MGLRAGTGTIRCLFVLAAAAVVWAGAAQASHRGEVTPVPDRGPALSRAAGSLAKATAGSREVRVRSLKRATFSAIPPGGDPTAISTKRLAGFPLAGRSFAIMTTGDSGFADDRNEAPDLGAGIGGPFIRGARDVTILRIKVDVPGDADCLSIRFKYLTEEFPEFVGSQFNDAFIAEVGRSSWSAGTNQDPRITAPGNFAFDERGNVISVNGAGDATMSERAARGTTYDGATRRLRASTPVEPGRRVLLYLSVFDQGDRDYDSAVCLDNLTLDRREPCSPGAVRD